MGQIAFVDGTIYRFVASFPGSVLSEIQDRWGNRPTITRTASAGLPTHLNFRISRITSPSGRWVDFFYTGSNPNVISQSRDNAGRTVTYGYSSDRLTSVTDAAGGVTQYVPHPVFWTPTGDIKVAARRRSSILTPLKIAFSSVTPPPSPSARPRASGARGAR